MDVWELWSFRGLGYLRFSVPASERGAYLGKPSQDSSILLEFCRPVLRLAYGSLLEKTGCRLSLLVLMGLSTCGSSQAVWGSGISVLDAATKPTSLMLARFWTEGWPLYLVKTSATFLFFLSANTSFPRFPQTTHPTPQPLSPTPPNPKPLTSFHSDWCFIPTPCQPYDRQVATGCDAHESDLGEVRCCVRGAAGFKGI